jgi:hypothetical protein
MSRHPLIPAISLLALAAACATRQPQIELTSSDFDLNPLVGDWRGDYNSTETGRSGTIAFTLRAGESSASGNVVMIPRGADSSSTGGADTARAGRQVLTIHFVRKEGGSIVGTLDPYNDPECECQVATTFQGTFQDGRTIAGTYTTVPSRPGTGVTTGKWHVTRIRRL